MFRGRNKRILHCQLKLQLNANGAGLSKGGALTTPSEGLRWQSAYKNFKAQNRFKFDRKKFVIIFENPNRKLIWKLDSPQSIKGHKKTFLNKSKNTV